VSPFVTMAKRTEPLPEHDKEAPMKASIVRFPASLLHSRRVQVQVRGEERFKNAGVLRSKWGKYSFKYELTSAKSLILIARDQACTAMQC
jgi:hypothetical protein